MITGSVVLMNQHTDALMSFDNDVPAHLATLLCAWFDRQSVRVTEAA